MPRGPGGAQIGIAYVAAPVGETLNVPGVRPTAARAWVEATVRSSESRARQVLRSMQRIPFQINITVQSLKSEVVFSVKYPNNDLSSTDLPEWRIVALVSSMFCRQFQLPLVREGPIPCTPHSI